MTKPRRIAATLLAAVTFTAVPVGSASAVVPRFPVVIDRPCRDVSDSFVGLDRIAGCLDLTLANARYQGLLGTTGLGWVDIGSSVPPKASQCSAGKITREDGWTWKCVYKNGEPRLVKTRAWARAAEMDYSHTGSSTRSTVTVTSTSGLTGCRLSASDKRLLGGRSVTLSGRSAQRVIDTSRVPAAIYEIRVRCADSRLNATSALMVRETGSSLLRSDCLDAWHDTIFGDIVPGYGRRMDLPTAKITTLECARLAPLTPSEYARAQRDAYLRIGQIAEREVRRVSAEQGLPICDAIAAVFKPVDTVGRLVAPTPSAELGIVVPVAGYRPDSYFPVLYRQWMDGPVAMESAVNCSSGVQSLRLKAGTWGSCPGSLNGGDQHQMFPTYALVTVDCPSTFDHTKLVPSSVCISWGDGIGNNNVGGVGKVFVAQGLQAGASSTSLNIIGDLTYDCHDRALRRGQFADVDVSFAPTLR